MPRLRLPRGSRIIRSREVRRVFEEGRSAASGPVVVYALGHGDDRAPRYGLVVGRKWGKAVGRNRIRRLLRESFRTARPDLPRGFDFLLLPRRPFGSRTMTEIRPHVEEATRRAADRFRRETSGQGAG